MIVFPNAKINLGLQVSAKRPDGFHNIASILYPIACSDVLEAVRSDHFSFSSSGLPIDASAENNLCYKAYFLLQKEFDLPPVSIHLHKIIPMGAGLGGGSGDGAFTLMLMNQLFQLRLNDEALRRYALDLGSDCPFFILNKPAYATGRGEILEPLEIPALKGKKILLVNPGLHISTGWAFGQLAPQKEHRKLPELILEPLNEWKGKLQNDFEPVVFKSYPQLREIQETLYNSGAIFAGMTGTGSTLFGIFDQLPGNYESLFDPRYRLILG
ncbi:4-(cytidine 5'-diphospho)-2-C-methyl-D-erythritol kinase [Flavihumibacter fluvii]|uniref:4-(cytidine 5'-diphospho)-2-C-methyl-D-erythritol kinase n=1 Tax=Flavihumibacter fluvii TaxID=2838157 RepID=UPI001BDE61F4|nr:4-(cytidine 5'-diphospho)-2-C-methyl-D-erythritol kinase [Flavihumibacter fluvii]ULQ53753.1 4-(cytidine 5'-diphospho)-2-C-methyl-D-erythritol kinase [Flavihumibacter fluvii]